MQAWDLMSVWGVPIRAFHVLFVFWTYSGDRDVVIDENRFRNSDAVCI